MKQNHRKVNQNNFQKTNLLYWNLLFCLFGFSNHDDMYTHLFMLTSILLSLLLLTRDVFRILHISLITCFVYHMIDYSLSKALISQGGQDRTG